VSGTLLHFTPRLLRRRLFKKHLAVTKIHVWKERTQFHFLPFNSTLAQTRTHFANIIGERNAVWIAIDFLQQDLLRVSPPRWKEIASGTKRTLRAFRVAITEQQTWTTATSTVSASSPSQPQLATIVVPSFIEHKLLWIMKSKIFSVIAILLLEQQLQEFILLQHFQQLGIIVTTTTHTKNVEKLVKRDLQTTN
jgi:hypothetical protein